MDILIRNSTLISMSEKREKIEKNIDLRIQGNKIIEIGQNLELNNKEKIIDATGKVVMPGLINTHAHIPMSIFRETLDGYNLQDWLCKKIWPMEDKLTNSDVYYASLLSFIEMIQTGCTTINDMYFMTEDIIKAAKDTKIRLQTSRTLMGDIDEGGNNRIKELEILLNKHQNKDELITFNIGIHGLYTSTLPYIQQCIKYANEKNLPIHMHFCENSKEVDDIKNAYKTNPVYILREEFKEHPLILAHCVKLSPQDIENLKGLNISVSHCPISNLKLGCGISNISEMFNQNINVTLGTDGQGSGSNLDLFETMKYTALLQKGLKEDSTLLPAYEILKMATINGAKALHLDKQIGSLEEGKSADIIILDLNSVTTNPINDLCSQIVYNVKGSNVNTTIINGEILMEDRKIFHNQKEIFEKCENIINRIKE